MSQKHQGASSLGHTVCGPAGALPLIGRVVGWPGPISPSWNKGLGCVISQVWVPGCRRAAGSEPIYDSKVTQTYISLSTCLLSVFTLIFSAITLSYHPVCSFKRHLTSSVKQRTQVKSNFLHRVGTFQGLPHSPLPPPQPGPIRGGTSLHHLW